VITRVVGGVFVQQPTEKDNSQEAVTAWRWWAVDDGSTIPICLALSFLPEAYLNVKLIEVNLEKVLPEVTNGQGQPTP
jgi:hypothetical protein